VEMRRNALTPQNHRAFSEGGETSPLISTSSQPPAPSGVEKRPPIGARIPSGGHQGESHLPPSFSVVQMMPPRRHHPRAAPGRVALPVQHLRGDHLLQQALPRLLLHGILSYAAAARFSAAMAGLMRSLQAVAQASGHNDIEPMMVNRIFTLGYEGLSLEAFIGHLKAAGVRTVLDVRANPLSRKPGFSKSAFSAALHAAGIVYAHLPALGCPKAVRDRYKRDGDWAAYTRGFLAHLDGQAEALAELAQIARHSPSCLVCFEADFNHCHRTFVARSAAKLGGLRVIHLTDRTEIPDVAARSVA
jgi:hypothetical protein